MVEYPFKAVWHHNFRWYYQKKSCFFQQVTQPSKKKWIDW